MSHQFGFYLTSEDTQVVEQVMRSVAPMLILHSRAPTSQPLVLPSLDFDVDGKPWIYFFLVRPEDLPKVAMRFVDAQGYWVVDVVRSPVIEFTKSPLKNDQVGLGRCYFKDAYFDEAGVLVKKEDAFLRWARTVFRKAKASLRKVGDAYVGECASEIRARKGARSGGD